MSSSSDEDKGENLQACQVLFDEVGSREIERREKEEKEREEELKAEEEKKEESEGSYYDEEEESSESESNDSESSCESFNSNGKELPISNPLLDEQVLTFKRE